MAKSVTLCILFILSSFLTIHFVVGKHNGLTIKLIHRNSPESPFYQPDLTYTQRIKRLFDQSKTRLNYLSKSPTALRSKVNSENFIFSTQLGLGSFTGTHEHYKSYNFVLDVGSEVTWLECQDCKLPGNHCLRQIGEPFPDRSSTSYEKLLCNHTHHHTLCNTRECIGHYCTYKTQYGDDSTSKGVLASETFTFDANTGGRKEKVHNLVFGCGFDIRNMKFQNGSNIAGVLGLGWGPKSFVKQLGNKSHGKFSYCLPSLTQPNITTYLQFGDHIPTLRSMNSITLNKYSNEVPYYVDLEGIKVGATPLNISEHDLARRLNKTGGCVLDTGSSISHIVDFAFVKLKERLIAYIENVHGYVRVEVPRYELCYKRTGGRQGFRNLPTITFIFKRNVHFELGPHNIFWDLKDRDETFCLAMMPNNRPNRWTIIGAFQQTDHRFIYSTHQNLLHFAPEKCAPNA